ncbi:hypothetical protein E2C01_087490 [Portunus trituberculatus]|uniref:Uncharacterized protein n=1 Tax=Portunus trituberculatus TaxID=210409 RepID=A0A5B7J883_PORTR|nr:hypothetical protein [Portunus trituberculatus]
MMPQRKKSLTMLGKKCYKRKNTLPEPSQALATLLRNLNSQIAATSNISVNETCSEEKHEPRHKRSSSMPPPSCLTNEEEGSDAASSYVSSDEEGVDYMQNYIDEIYGNGGSGGGGT